MSFSPEVKAWLLLLTLVISTGTGAGMTAFLGGSHWGVSIIIGLGVAATNVYHALSDSPKLKASSQEPPTP